MSGAAVVTVVAEPISEACDDGSAIVGKARKYVERTPTARAGQEQQKQSQEDLVFLALVRSPAAPTSTESAPKAPAERPAEQPKDVERQPAPNPAPAPPPPVKPSMSALKLPVAATKPAPPRPTAAGARPGTRKPNRKAAMMRVSFHPSANLLEKPKGLRGGRVDLNVTGQTHRAYADSSSAVANRAAPQAPVDVNSMTLALTHRSKDKWTADQQELTSAMMSAYGDVGARGVSKGASMQGEDAVSDEVRSEYVPKVRKTVRAQQETMRLRKQVAANPMLRGITASGKEEAGEAREKLEARHVAALQKLQSAARGLSARREAKSRSMAFRGRNNCAQVLQRAANANAQKQQRPGANGAMPMAVM